MEEEKHKVIWVRMPLFSPWCRHVSVPPVWVSLSSGLAVLTNKPPPIPLFCGMSWNAPICRLSHHLWLLLTTVREVTCTHLKNLYIPDYSVFSRRICALFVYSGRCSVDSGRLISCDQDRLKKKKINPWETKFTVWLDWRRRRIIWGAQSGLHILFSVFSAGSFSEAGPGQSVLN